MDATTLTVAGVVAMLGALLAWVVRATRRPPVVRPPDGPPWVPPSVAGDQAQAAELRAQAAHHRAEVEADHQADRAELATDRSEIDTATDLEDLLAAGRRHQAAKEDS